QLAGGTGQLFGQSFRIGRVSDVDGHVANLDAEVHCGGSGAAEVHFGASRGGYAADTLVVDQAGDLFRRIARCDSNGFHLTTSGNLDVTRSAAGSGGRSTADGVQLLRTDLGCGDVAQR